MKKFQEYLNEFNLNIPLASEVASNLQNLEQDYAKLYQLAIWTQQNMPNAYGSVFAQCQTLQQKISLIKQQSGQGVQQAQVPQQAAHVPQQMAQQQQPIQ